MITESQIFEKLRNGELTLLPMQFRLLEEMPRIMRSPSKEEPFVAQPDALLEGTWQKQKFLFVAEIKRYSSSKRLGEAMSTVSRIAKEIVKTESKLFPLVVTTWLSAESLKILEKNEISGIDLNGNGIIVIPNKVLIFRTGQPNAYPDSRLVRNVYSGVTSLVSRVFLARPRYKNLTDILQEILARKGKITQPTVSKAIQQLQEDLVVSREKEDICLLQPAKLLERLASEFSTPRIIQSRRFIVTNAPIGKTLADAANRIGADVVMTGATSVEQFTAFANEPLKSFYCNAPLSKLIAAIDVPIEPDSRFANVELLETEDLTPFFDSRWAGGPNVSSKLQSWLELSHSGDMRQREVSESIKLQILADIDRLMEAR